MARPIKRKARKDYPGITKGQEYWYVKIKTGPRSSRVMRQLEPFKRSQLTSSDYLARLYDLEDQIAAIEDLDTLNQIAEDLRSLGSEQEEKKEAMPQGLQEGETGQLLQERADACDAAAGTLEDIAQRWEEARDSFEPDEDADEDDQEFDEGPFIDEAQSVSIE